MTINADKKFCYRICHIDNLRHLLGVGLCTKHHPKAAQDFRTIGNREIIGIRDTTPVKINGYGTIGEYVPFYLTPRSMMLYNIITGYRVPLVPQLSRDEIIIIRCTIEKLSKCGRFFFTDGHANDAATDHFVDLRDLDKIDWEVIQKGNFSKSDGDFDRPRRYQAEFLVHNIVPLNAIESIVVYSDNTANFVAERLKQSGKAIEVHVIKEYFF